MPSMVKYILNDILIIVRYYFLLHFIEIVFYFIGVDREIAISFLSLVEKCNYGIGKCRKSGRSCVLKNICLALRRICSSS